MTGPPISAVSVRDMPEDRGSGSLQAYMLGYLRELSLWGYHPHRPEWDNGGWPDWVIIGPAGLLYRELKTEYGDLTPAQRDVGSRIVQAGGNWAVWRPRDLVSGEIWRQLKEISGLLAG